MDKFFKFKVKETVGTRTNPIIVGHTEIVCAKTKDAIVKDYIRRVGKRPTSYNITEIAECTLKNYKGDIYVVI